MSLSKFWNENECFSLVFTKMLVFVPKTGSLHTGTVQIVINNEEYKYRRCIFVLASSNCKRPREYLKWVSHKELERKESADCKQTTEFAA